MESHMPLMKIRLVKQAVPMDPSGAASYEIAPPSAVPEQQPHQMPAEEIDPHAYHFIFRDVELGATKYSFGDLVQHHTQMDRPMKFTISRLFMCQILVALIEIPDSLLQNTCLSNWLALRMCGVLCCMRQRLVEIMVELLRHFPKEKVLDVITTYLDLRYVASTKQPHAIFCSIIRDVCQIGHEEGEDVVLLEDVGICAWKRICPSMQVLWVQDRNPDGPEPDSPQSPPSSDSESSQDENIDTTRKRKRAPKRRLQKRFRIANDMLNGVQDMIHELRAQLRLLETQWLNEEKALGTDEWRSGGQ